MILDFMKHQRETKLNLCTIQKVEVTTSKHHSIFLALQINNS